MDNLALYKELKIEREKLNKLIDEALKNGTPISQTQEVIEQSQKVNHLVEILQIEMNKKTEKER